MQYINKFGTCFKYTKFQPKLYNVIKKLYDNVFACDFLNKFLILLDYTESPLESKLCSARGKTTVKTIM